MLDRRDYLRAASAAALATVVAGCGGGGSTPTEGDGGGADGGDDAGDGDGDGDGDDGGGTPTPTGTDGGMAGTDGQATHGEGVTPTGDAESGQAAYPDYNWDQLDGESAQEATTVTMVNFAYDPIVARVPAGEQIAFPNEDGSPHTVTIPAVGIDQEVAGGEQTTVTIDEPGTYDYVCRFHPPDMLGRLVVEEGLTVSGGGGSTETSTEGDDIY